MDKKSYKSIKSGKKEYIVTRMRDSVEGYNVTASSPIEARKIAQQSFDIGIDFDVVEHGDWNGDWHVTLVAGEDAIS